jgi:hypothetical protein
MSASHSFGSNKGNLRIVLVEYLFKKKKKNLIFLSGEGESGADESALFLLFGEGDRVTNFSMEKARFTDSW